MSTGLVIRTKNYTVLACDSIAISGLELYSHNTTKIFRLSPDVYAIGLGCKEIYESVLKKTAIFLKSKYECDNLNVLQNFVSIALKKESEISSIQMISRIFLLTIRPFLHQTDADAGETTSITIIERENDYKPKPGGWFVLNTYDPTWTYGIFSMMYQSPQIGKNVCSSEEYTIAVAKQLIFFIGNLSKNADAIPNILIVKEFDHNIIEGRFHNLC